MMIPEWLVLYLLWSTRKPNMLQKLFLFTFLVSVVSGSNDGSFRTAVYEHIINGANELIDPNDPLRHVTANLDWKLLRKLPPMKMLTS